MPMSPFLTKIAIALKIATEILAMDTLGGFGEINLVGPISRFRTRVG